jgi:3-hydroxyisobutyrate dehydrogenase-like beta-hydroxyacid dehydrogenase
MRTGFIGLGDQGFPMAANIVADQAGLVAHDIRISRVEAIERLGARGVASPAEVARASDIICLCVFDDAQLKQAICGADGVLVAARPDSILVIHSTVSVDAIEFVDREARSRSVHLVDAPVAGGPAGAVARNLLYMVGGAVEAVQRCLPLLQPSARHIVLTGPTGSGMRAKAIHQMMLLSNMASAYDGYTLGTAWGLSLDTIEAVVAHGGAQSRIADRWARLSLPDHAADLFRKDIDLSILAAQELEVDLTVALQTRNCLDRIIAGRTPKTEEDT